jgi:hypothetical protein
MKLDQLHTEGVFIKSYDGLDPSNILTAKETGGKRRGGSRGSGGLTDLYMNREYHYREEDDPEDLVHLKPLNKVTTLPTVPDDPHAIRSFMGVKIHYAFSVVPADNFTDQAVRGGWELPPNFTQLVKELRGLYEAAMHTQGIPRKDRKPLDTDADLHHRLDRISSRISFLEQQLREFQSQKVQKDIDDLNREKQLIMQMLGFMDKLKLRSISELEEDDRGTFSYGVGDKERSVSRREFTASHLTYASQSLAKKIKNPTTEQEREMSYKVTEAAVVNLARLYAPFDIIVLPSSSAPYNTETLVPLVHAQNGWQGIPVIQLNKITGDKALDEIDVGSLISRAEQYHERAKAGERIHPGLIITQNQLAQIRDQIGNVAMPPVENDVPLSPINPAP